MLMNEKTCVIPIFEYASSKFKGSRKCAFAQDPLMLLDNAMITEISCAASYIFSTKKSTADLFVCLFDSLPPSKQSFSYVGMGLPGLNQY